MTLVTLTCVDCGKSTSLDPATTVNGMGLFTWWSTQRYHRCKHCFNRLEPAEAHARDADPETSHDAAASVVGIRDRQNAILDLLKQRGPMIDETIARTYAQTPNLPKQSPSGLRTRRSELVELGLVIWTGGTEKTTSGRQSRIWAAT